MVILCGRTWFGFQWGKSVPAKCPFPLLGFLVVVSRGGNVPENCIGNIHRLILHQHDIKRVHVRFFSVFHLWQTALLVNHPETWPGDGSKDWSEPDRWGSRRWGCSEARALRRPWSGLLKSRPAAARWVEPAALWGPPHVTQHLLSCWRSGSVDLWRPAGPP